MCKFYISKYFWKDAMLINIGKSINIIYHIYRSREKSQPFQHVLKTRLKFNPSYLKLKNHKKLNAILCVYAGVYDVC